MEGPTASMESKEKETFEIDDYEVKVIRREQQVGDDKIYVNVYSYPEDRLRDYNQYTFRVKRDDDYREAVFTPSGGNGEPSVTALRGLHKFGFDCTNYSIEGLIDMFDPDENLKGILQISEQLVAPLDREDPTAAYVVRVSLRMVQHVYGLRQNAQEDPKSDLETLTGLVREFSKEGTYGTSVDNIEPNEELAQSWQIVADLIEEEQGYDMREIIDYE